MRLRVHSLFFDLQLSIVHYCREVDLQKSNRFMQPCTFHLIMLIQAQLFGNQSVS